MCQIYILLLTSSIVFTGNWTLSLFVGPLSSPRDILRTAKLVLPASSNDFAAAMESSIRIFSREMVRLQLAGKSEYSLIAEKEKQADKTAKTIALSRGFADQQRCINKSVSTQHTTVCDFIIRRSVLYKGVLAGEELAVNLMLESDDESDDMATIPDDTGQECTEYICFHKLENTDVAAAVCILATELQGHPALWNRLGKAVMAVINEQNNVSSKTQSGFRLCTLIIDDWGLATEVSTRCSFVQGMDSLFQPDVSVQHVEAIEPPCSLLHSPRDPRVPP